MAPDKDSRDAGEAFEVAYYTEELGRPLQRKLLQRRLEELTEGHSVSAASADGHGEDPGRERHAAATRTPREDRAG